MGITLTNKQLETTLIFGDVHGIYMDKKWWSIMKQVIADLKPDRVVMDGDIVDFYAISKFDKDPSRRDTLQTEIDETKKFLDSLRFWHKGEVIWVEGNHEARLQKYLWSKAPEMSSLEVLSMDHLFDLSKQDIKYIPSRGREAYYQLGKIKVGHFNKASQESAYTEKALVTRYACSIIQGHTHRLGKYYKTFGQETDTVVGVGSGCGCELDPEYCSDPNWQQGFVVVSKLRGKNRYHIQDVPIINHETLFNGKLYRA